MPPASRLPFEICGRRLVLAAEGPALAEPLGRLFRGYAAPADDGETAPQFHALREGHAFHLDSSDGRRTSYESLVDLAVAVEFALTEAFLHECREEAHVHAGGVVPGDRAVLFLGRAGAGKSSLAFAWSRAGVPALGDDVVLLDAQGRAHPFKRLFKLDPALLASAGIPVASTPCWEEGSSTAWWDPMDGAGWAEAAPVTALVLTRFEEGAAVELCEAPRREGLNALAHSLMSTGLNRTASFRALSRVVEGARTLELRFGSALEAVEALGERLG